LIGRRLNKYVDGSASVVSKKGLVRILLVILWEIVIGWSVVFMWLFLVGLAMFGIPLDIKIPLSVLPVVFAWLGIAIAVSSVVSSFLGFLAYVIYSLIRAKKKKKRQIEVEHD
jgi:hypothetical protein